MSQSLVKRRTLTAWLWLPLASALSASVPAAGVGDREPDRPVLFNRDIRPIFSDTCFPCHGFDAAKRKANLRLDTSEGAAALIEGRQPIVPGNREKSELWRRVKSSDPKVMMPPPESGKKLSPAQLDALERWIDAGAKYQKHWAFEPVSKPAVPNQGSDWARNDIDRFISATLGERRLQPAPEARREILIRRVTLALTGLGPTSAEIDAFLADGEPGAYDRVVERLLGSPRFGEHMARYWLDVARYGDTHGLHLDNERSMWIYRDWVVRAFNENLPFDQFTVWQLAGDLLPDPTRDQLIASGFNRCNVSTSEGGAIDEEFQVRYAVDRVETTSVAWMGLTMGCAVCHDHKLDPITQKEFYQMFSIFNNISEKAMDGNALLPPPSLPVPTPEQEKEQAGLEQRLAELNSTLDSAASGGAYADPATLTNGPKAEPVEVVWVEDDFPPEANVAVDGTANRWITKAEGPVFSGEKALQRSGKGLHQVHYTKCANPLTIGMRDHLFAYVYLDPKDLPRAIMLQYHGEQWQHRAVWGDPDAIPFGKRGTTERFVAGDLPTAGQWVRLEVPAAKMGLKPGMQVSGMAFTMTDGTAYWDKAGLISTQDPAKDPSRSLAAWIRKETNLGDKSAVPPRIKDVLSRKSPDAAEEPALRTYFLARVNAKPSPQIAALRSEIKPVSARLEELKKKIPATMISHELDTPRPAWVLIRGEYDKHGDPVGPGVPAILPPLPATEKTNRLTLAKWLVNPDHPLTARVVANRFWQQFFGTGIVKTAEDFGSKGEWPSHPELLDWLANHFIQSGWDTKELVRLIVTSATFRQDSRVSRELAVADPENRLLGRGPRYRLDAEILRDNALYLSGLLNPVMGGRGVRSYQPPGIWEAVGYTTSDTAKYKQDHGDSLYRRSLYLFWKRTAPPPSMTTFDAPSREQCRARRERTNTPLQALLTMNDPQYFEAARHLAGRMWREGGAEDSSRLRYGFRLATGRLPDEKEEAVLAETLAAERLHFTGNEAGARKAIAVGESPVATDAPATELAAYTLVANLLLNLDDTLTLN